MPISENQVVSFHYRLSESGRVVESSFERAEPLHVLVGHHNIVPGLEQALLGREVGERFNVSVPPELGYGPHREGMVVRVPRKYFGHTRRLEPGAVVALALRNGGQEWVTVVKVGMTTVDVDRNPPMAGKTLDFEIEVLAARTASSEEIAHGHAHGPDGVHAH